MPERRSPHAGNAQGGANENTNDSTPQANKKNKTAPERGGEGPPAKKFQRVYRACNRCRSKKEKCDGSQPTCSACVSANQTCVYETGVRKRGLPQGYVRVLEMLLGSVLSTLEGSEEALKKCLDKLSVEKEADWRLAVLERWKSSVLVKDVERLLPSLEVPDERDILSKGFKRSESTSVDRNHAAELLPADWRLPITDLARVPTNSSQDVYNPGLGSSVDTSQMQHHFSPLDITSGASYNDSPDNVQRSPLVTRDGHHALPTATRQDSSIRRLSLPTRAWRLFDVFFAYTHCWFPIISKVDVLRIAYTYSTIPLELSRDGTGSGAHAALWAILAYASCQVTGENLASHHGTTLSDIDWTSEQLYNVARGLIPGEDAEYEPGHVQALLLLGLCKIGAGQWSIAWLLIGYAVRVALVLDLHLSNTSEMGLTSELHGRKRHVFLGCFILDTFIAAKIGKLPHLRSEIVHRVGIPENDLEEWDPWLAPSDLSGPFGRELSQRRPAHAGSTFNQFVKVACILNDIVSFSPQKQITQNQYQHFSQTLQDWKSELPRQCQIATPIRDITSTSLCPLPHVLGLHLSYLTAYAFLESRNPQHSIPDISLGIDGGLLNTTIHLFRCFSAMFGIVAVPPTYRIIATVDQHDGLAMQIQGREEQLRRDLAETLVLLDQMWLLNISPAQKYPSTNNFQEHTLVTPSIPVTLSVNQQAEESMGSLPQRELPQPYDTQFGLMDYSGLSATSTRDYNPSLEVSGNWNQSYNVMNPIGLSTLLQSPLARDMSMSTFSPLHDQGLQPMPMEELDSILDQLAALDSTEMADRQSQFLRNFGFGPDMTSAELGYIFGQQEMSGDNPG